MAVDAELRTRLLATFRPEAEELLRALNDNLRLLGSGLPPAESAKLAEETFREMHTLKGAARSVGLVGVESVCQACESILSDLLHERLTLAPAIVEELRDAAQGIERLLAEGGDPRALLERLGRADASGAEATADKRELPAEPVPALPASDTVRLSTATLDALLRQAEDLLVPRLAVTERTAEARELVDRLGRPLANGDSALHAVETAAKEHLARLEADGRRLGGIVDGLQEELRQLRMTPASAILDVLPAMGRDLAEEQGKELEVRVDGGRLEVDRKVLEAIKDPLIHLVRNAVAHGIEPADARVEAGKERRGRVEVRVSILESGRVEFTVADDGAGLDPIAVRDAAVRFRLIAPEAAEALTDEETVDLLFRSGLSTSPIITDLSGHGLGLAIVKERVERLEGEVRLDSRSGRGTTVSLFLPASIAAFRGLLVEEAGQRFLLPLAAIERVVRVGMGEIGIARGREVVRVDGEPLPVARLAHLLGLDLTDQLEPESELRCVVVRSGTSRAGVLVEDVLGDREVVVKELGELLTGLRHVAGAALLGTGEVVLILGSADLVDGATQLAPVQISAPLIDAEAEPAVILVVDDSITTRTMERSLLETAGYRVEVAADGAEAWATLREQPFDLVVSDVDMPRMDGLELTARIRNHQPTAGLPVILVTALESREDKERGIEVGANAYIVKSSFDQSNLLELIRRLV